MDINAILYLNLFAAREEHIMDQATDLDCVKANMLFKPQRFRFGQAWPTARGRGQFRLFLAHVRFPPCGFHSAIHI